MKYNIENESLIVSYYLNHYHETEVFHPELFQDENIQSIVKSINECKKENLQFSLDSISVELNKFNSKVKFQDLIDLKEAYKDFSNIDYHVRKLKQDYNKQVVSKGLIGTVISKVNASGEVTSKDLIDSLDSIKKSLIDTDEKIFLTSEELVERYENTLQSRMNPVKTKSSGFKCLDEKITRPGAAGEIYIMASLRGSGKSAMKQTIQNNLINKGVPVVEFSLEMSEESGMDRHIAMKTGIPMMDLNKNPKQVLEDNRFKQISQELKKFKNFLFTDKPDFTFDMIDVGISKAKEIFSNNGVFDYLKDDYMVVTLDVLNMVMDFGDQTPQSILIAMDKYHKIVKKHNIHSLGLVQINETKLRSKSYSDPEALDKYRPNLEDIYGGSAYAQRARLVSVLHRPKFLKERMFPEMSEIWEAEPDILQYHCVKQNDGEIFFQEFIFDGERMRIIPYIRMEDD